VGVLCFLLFITAPHHSYLSSGCAQVVVLGPCTFLVTAAVTGGDKSVSVYAHTMNTYRTRGIAGFYHGGTALILRQGRTHDNDGDDDDDGDDYDDDDDDDDHNNGVDDMMI